jgi:hypothetical protein
MVPTYNCFFRRFWSKRPFRNWWSGLQLIEQRLGLLQIECVETFGKPTVDRREKIAGIIVLALSMPMASEVERRA